MRRSAYRLSLLNEATIISLLGDAFVHAGEELRAVDLISAMRDFTKVLAINRVVMLSLVATFIQAQYP